MRDLLATAAGGAAATGCATGQPPPPTVDIQGTSAVVAQGSSVPNANNVPPKPTATPGPDPTDMGYGVVDPMPPPPVCPNLATTIGVTAHWKKTQSGLVIEVKLGKPSFPSGVYRTTDKVDPGSGKVDVKKQTADAIEVHVTFPANAHDGYFQVPVQCPQGSAHVSVSVGPIVAAAKDGVQIPVTLHDTW